MSARSYYNEVNHDAAGWLRNLIAAGLVPAGDVDERSIVDVQPGDLAGYTQCHFFAGIGGWSAALRLAGWPDDQPIWTGSCPCQPFSVAGKRAGTDDVRHLWPDFFRLIRAARPAVVMGEQVARKAGLGWLDGVLADLEGDGYAGRAVCVPACAVDAPHIRSRIYWCAVADTEMPGCEARYGKSCGNGAARPGVEFHDGGSMADAAAPGEGRGQLQRSSEGCGAVDERTSGEPSRSHGCGSVEHAASIGRGEGRPEPEFRGGRSAASGADAPIGMGDADSPRLALRGSLAGDARPERATAERADGRNGSWWAGADIIACHDGKARRAKPGVSLLAYGVPARVAKWRGLGNAIVPPLAAEVIAAFMDIDPSLGLLG